MKINEPLPGGFYFDVPPVFDEGQRTAPRKVRVFTWVILAVNVLFLAWMVFGVKSVANSTCTPAMTQLACDAARASSKSVGTLMAGLLWVAADVLLGVIWLVRNPSSSR